MNLQMRIIHDPFIWINKGSLIIYTLARTKTIARQDYRTGSRDTHIHPACHWVQEVDSKLLINSLICYEEGVAKRPYENVSHTEQNVKVEQPAKTCCNKITHSCYQRRFHNCSPRGAPPVGIWVRCSRIRNPLAGSGCSSHGNGALSGPLTHIWASSGRSRHYLDRLQ